jgi:uncharacterized protein
MSGTPANQTIPIESKLEGRRVRLAAIGDLHMDESAKGSLLELFTDINRQADILVICGDMTTHGRPEQLRLFLDELSPVEIPIVAVFGNHDVEGGCEEELTALLRDRGVHLLNGDHVVVEGIGFAGVKGFAGGFGRGALAPFGEKLIKDFVQTAIDESLRLENALRSLSTEVKVVVLHYAPIVGTILGEPEYLYPFLGSSRLLQPIDTLGASVVFHGHAHHGSAEGATPEGIPVFNVSAALLRGTGDPYRIWVAEAPDRRKDRG